MYELIQFAHGEHGQTAIAGRAWPEALLITYFKFWFVQSMNKMNKNELEHRDESQVETKQWNHNRRPKYIKDKSNSDIVFSQHPSMCITTQELFES